jgi:UDP-N-acetylglucosamine--N-acetylmuramyl-(pentapeptide) pyrophosphoryl-undecaprenol N-acetylglucosamine transferase
MPRESRPVLIAAGGTGGHVYPGLAVAAALRSHDVPVVWMGTRKGLEARVVPAAGIPIAWLSVTGLRGKGIATRLLAPFRLLRALTQALAVMLRHRPCAVLGMGGFVAGPAGLMAVLTGRPLLIHEQNAVAGLTNRVLARIARRVFTGFPNALPGEEMVGNPVRVDIAALPHPETRFAGRTGALRLLVVGGSLGAKALNETVPAALAETARQGGGFIVRHQAGKHDLAPIRAAYEAAGVQGEVSEYIEDMAEAYGWADVVICRAGALTLAELCAAGLGSVLVPYPYAVDDHQTVNARHLVSAGAAVLMPQTALSPSALGAALMDLSDRERLSKMAAAARGLAHTDAAEKVASACLEFCRRVA